MNSTLTSSLSPRWHISNSGFRFQHKELTQLATLLAKTKKSLRQYSHVNKKALDQYVRFKEQREQLEARRSELDESHKAIHALITALDTKKDQAIQRTFKMVAKFFAEVFEQLTGEGKQSCLLSIPSLCLLCLLQLAVSIFCSAMLTGLLHMVVTWFKGLLTLVLGCCWSSFLILCFLGKAQLVMQKPTTTESGPTQGTQGGEIIPLYSGVDIKVSFTRSGAQQRMHQLSGGQQSLVALALIFAIQRCDPAPFYVFDEIDSALGTLFVIPSSPAFLWF